MDTDRYKLILDFAAEGFWDWDLKVMYSLFPATSPGFFPYHCATMPTAQPVPGASQISGAGTVTAVPRDEVPPLSRAFPSDSPAEQHYCDII